MGISRLVVGAEARVYVNAQLLGGTETLEWEVQEDHAESYGIDTLEPLELVPQVLHVQGVLRIYRQHGDGGPEGRGIGAPWPNVALQRYGSLLVLDRLTDTILLRVDRCAFTNQRWQVDRGHVKGSVSFRGLDYSAGTEPAR